ncbi:hydroxysqualene dehydroxylase HpnE [Micromonospora polyrhachis]|uniref:Squalene-associated FAD-dependent desaturase n=1 Tax=Micromonospora polyrhachis TaxID=1282883 RepID=A0A7W7SXD3_9ACTN|nr:hydroxysqualene dehydroxylase HpnE [Micromonospora polyrhachis]MBB4962633.1 squalene-associated FAD-dependent desaturase [Micromonospora polyrhachis]
MKAGHVCVIGGGLAGIAATLRLTDAGHRVTLLEARPALGGATYSFRRGDLAVDTGQHVFLRCYEEYRNLLGRLGTTERTAMQEAFTVPILRPGAPPHTLTRDRRLPAPAHLLPALLTYRPLRLRQRFAAIRAASALRAVEPEAPASDEISFGAWLADHGQDPQTVQRLWELICVAALNAPPRHASLALAARVFRTGLFDRADAGDIGRPTASLAELHSVPALGLLRQQGANVRTGTRVRDITVDPSGFQVRSDHIRVTAEAVILAVPHQQAARLVPEAAVPDRARWSSLGAAPIVNVHVRYRQRVTDLEFAAGLDTPVQWVFDRTPPDSPGQYLVVSISAAESALHTPAGVLARTYLAALAELFPSAGRTAVHEVFVTREPRATFRQRPGTRSVRPPSRTALPGLALAGAWTDTGWPDTMEGAVRSGQRAAGVVLEHLASKTTLPEAST